MATRKILVVDDELPLRQALVEKLTREGFSVCEAANGEEALSLIEKEQPDLVLLDIVMPRMDGMTMLSELRKEEWGKKTKVILLTNLGETEKIAESLEYGVFDFLIKSDWKMEDVIEKIRSTLGA